MGFKHLIAILAGAALLCADGAVAQERERHWAGMGNQLAPTGPGVRLDTRERK